MYIRTYMHIHAKLQMIVLCYIIACMHAYIILMAALVAIMSIHAKAIRYLCVTTCMHLSQYNIKSYYAIT